MHETYKSMNYVPAGMKSVNILWILGTNQECLVHSLESQSMGSIRDMAKVAGPVESWSQLES